MVNVMVAVDGSDHADNALAWYIDILHKDGNNVLLGYVSEPAQHAVLGFRAGLAVSDSQWAVMLAQRIKKEDDLMSRHIQRLKNKKITHRVIRSEGDAGLRLCQLAEEHDVDYIVTGSRGQGTVRRTILGSVSDYVLHHSQCPVLICRKYNQ